MTNNDSAVDRHYTSDQLLQRITAALEAAGKDLTALKVDDLAAVSEFHTRGREATAELAALAGLKPTDTLLDVGCGLGGTARYLADSYGCRVTGVDLTEQYVAVGNQLTEMIGLTDRVQLECGSALELPFEDGSFACVWTEHAQMNIADKDRFYGEIARVLQPGGRLLFHDVFRGTGEEVVYPVPWAENESISHLATEAAARASMEQAGLSVETWAAKNAESIAFFDRVLVKIATDGPPPLGIHLLMGDNAREKLKNCVENLQHDRVSVVIGVAKKG